MRVENVNLDAIYINEDFNCRGPIAPIDVLDLVKDIERRTIIEGDEIVDPGLIEPIILSELPLPDQQTYNKQYNLVAGFRRMKSFIILKRPQIPAIIKPPMTELDARILNLNENLQRKDLNIAQEAHALKELFDLGIGEVKIAETLHKSRGWVQIRGLFLDLPTDIQNEVAAGVINQMQIRHLHTIMNKQGKEKLYEVARKIKDAKTKGEKLPETNPRRQVITAKLVRTKQEMFNLMDHIRVTVGNGLHTRTIAWCAGEISSLELYESIKEYATVKGVIYTIPYGEEE